MRKSVPILLVCIFSVFFVLNSYAQKNKRPKIGVVLSGGGAKGFAHIGVLKALDEAGVKVDYIGGTSMGGIIGGLYAIGYKPDTMLKLVGKQDWEFLLSDKVPLREIPLEEKIYDNRYFLAFPIRKDGLSLPKGLVVGQNISLLLRNLTSPVFYQKDFSKFPIPFLTVATNIVDGSPVVIKSGDLAEAFRATMSIPSFFIPVDYAGNYVVDGGVVDNYPVREVKKMGADIIIGVDVQSPLYNREELNSLVKVISQTNSFYNQRSFVKNKKLTDIYIQPNVKGYDMLSFDASDTLIQRGIEAGKAVLPELLHLVDSLNKIYPEEAIELNTMPLDSVFVKAVIVKGLNRVPEKLVTSDLNIRSNAWVPLTEIETSIEHLYASGFFLLVEYKLLVAGKGVVVEVSVQESKTGVIGVGLHYDSYYGISLLATLKYKNLGIKGSNLYVNAALGELPILKALYYVDRGRRPGFGLETKAFGFNIPFYMGSQKLETLSIKDFQFDVMGQLILQEKYSLGWRAGYEILNIKSNIGSSQIPNRFYSFFKGEIFHKVISFDKWNFPRRGILLSLNLKYINYLQGSNQFVLDQDILDVYNFNKLSYTFSGKFKSAIPIGKQFTILPEAFVGISLGNTNPPLQELFFLSGGDNHYFDGVGTFYGLNFMQEFGKYVISGSISLREKVANKNYVEVNLSLGGIGNKLTTTLNSQNISAGYGVSYAYDSYIGPIRIGLSGSNQVNSPILYVSMGYSF